MLGRQWLERIKIWKEYLPKLFYTECGSVSAEYAVTMEHLTLALAQALPKKLIRAGTAWGKKWEYGWFHCTVSVPKKTAGCRLVCFFPTGGESLVFVNGEAAGAIDKKHSYITLTRCSKGGERFDIYAESYAGHGLRPENGGPYGPDEIPVPEPSAKQAVTGTISWGIWNEAVFQTAVDFDVLYSLLQVLQPKSLRYQKVAKALQQFTLTADFELDEPERTKSILAAGSFLKPALACVNGSTAPVMSIFGQSHLDLAWEWPLEETKRKCARTYSTQLAFMDEYPEYKFLACEPYIFTMLEQYYPELMQRVKEKTAAGQCIADGAFYVESDTNIPCGEALIRQLVRGKRWFRDTLGSRTLVAWLPDTFGFSAALPQLLTGCGIPYFATQKLLRCDPECDPFPYNNFWWQGIDGSRVLSHMYKKNNAVITPQAVAERWNQDRIQQDNIEGMMFPFGYGDGGGGPDRQMLETVRRIADLEGIPRTRMESPAAFFERLKNGDEPVTETYTGELYLSWHRGSYTSGATIKRLCRKAEIALHDAEFYTAVCSSAGGADSLDALWRKLLLCQFHDVIAGTCIQRVHEEAERDLQEVLDGARASADTAVLADASAERAADDGQGVLISNTMGWERSVLVRSPDGSGYAELTVPPCGWTVVPYRAISAAAGKTVRAISCTMVHDGGSCYLKLENSCLIVRIGSNGTLDSVFDKESGTEFAAAPCNVFRMYKDVTPFYDAWEIAPMYKDQPVELTAPAKITIEEAAPECVRIHVSRALHDSTLEQVIVIRKDSRRIDFETSIDWHEKHKLLKVDFPLAVMAEQAASEIQFGYVRRPTHTSRQFDKDRYEACNHKYTAVYDENRGAAVLNDSRYGVSTGTAVCGDDCTGTVISLTLLKSAVIPDMRADSGMQRMTYSLYVFNSGFSESNVVHEAYELNNPLVPVPVTQAVPAVRSYFALDNPHVILETVKPADCACAGDENPPVVLRLYEAYGGTAAAVLTTSLPVESASAVSMDESAEVPQGAGGLVLESDEKGGKKIRLSFRPFEIKTILLKLAR